VNENDIPTDGEMMAEEIGAKFCS